MYLFFDTETTGLPRNWRAPLEDSNNWPRLVQAAWILCDNNGNELAASDFIIRPNGFIIPDYVAQVHGITTSRALKEGQPLADVLCKFSQAAKEARFVVGHNVGFDEMIVGAEFYRLGMKNSLDGKERICTMLAGAEYCGIENRYGYKWPKLSELHGQLFGASFDDAHNAAADIRITAKCFWEMKRRGIL